MRTKQAIGEFIASRISSDLSPRTIEWYEGRLNRLKGWLYRQRVKVRQDRERATEKDIAEIRYYQAKLKADKKGGGKSVKADLSFHTALAGASHNTVLTRFLSELRPLMRRWMEQKRSVIGGYHLVNEQHDEILRAIEAHDVQRARSALHNHLMSTGDKLGSILLRKRS